MYSNQGAAAPTLGGGGDSETLTVPNNCVGGIIGRAGQNIQVPFPFGYAGLLCGLCAAIQGAVQPPMG
jgi:hypothetical protein